MRAERFCNRGSGCDLRILVFRQQRSWSDRRRLDGPGEGDGTFAATEVTITQVPTNSFFSPPFSFDLAAHAIFNSFIVTGGAVAAWEFYAQAPEVALSLFKDSPSFPDYEETSLQLPDAVGSTGVVRFVDDTSGTFAFVAAEDITAVPLPASLPLMLLGLASFAAFRGRRSSDG